MLSLTSDYEHVDLTQEKSHKNPKFLLIVRPLSPQSLYFVLQEKNITAKLTRLLIAATLSKQILKKFPNI